MLRRIVNQIQAPSAALNFQIRWISARCGSRCVRRCAMGRTAGGDFGQCGIELIALTHILNHRYVDIGIDGASWARPDPQQSRIQGTQPEVIVALIQLMVVEQVGYDVTVLVQCFQFGQVGTVRFANVVCRFPIDDLLGAEEITVGTDAGEIVRAWVYCLGGILD